ncbi:hypothetical protein BJV78DRAFT_1158441, partial [Lactifluus subvellereus]
MLSFLGCLVLCGQQCCAHRSTLQGAGGLGIVRLHGGPPDEGIKVRDFIYELVPNSCKAPKVFDHPSPPLITTNWHMWNTQRNNGPQSGKALFRPIKRSGCWVSKAEVAMPPMRVHERKFRALTQYNSDGQVQHRTHTSHTRDYNTTRIPTPTFPGPYVSGVVQLGTVFLDASKISFSLGKTSAAMANGQIVTGILDHFPSVGLDVIAQIGSNKTLPSVGSASAKTGVKQAAKVVGRPLKKLKQTLSISSSQHSLQRRPYHYFICAAPKCKTGGVRRFQDSKDKSSTGNLRYHATCCFSEDAVLDAAATKKEDPCSIHSLFAHRRKQPVRCTICAYTNSEIRL